jgi:hypothetical protein
MHWLRSTRKWLLIAALALGVVAVVAVSLTVADEDGAAAGFAFLSIGAGLLLPVVLPLLALRSRWFRLLALNCALIAFLLYALLSLGGGFLLFPSALLVALTIFTPQPP